MKSSAIFGLLLTFVLAIASTATAQNASQDARKDVPRDAPAAHEPEPYIPGRDVP